MNTQSNNVKLCKKCGKGVMRFAGLCLDCAKKEIQWKVDMDSVFKKAIDKAEKRLKQKERPPPDIRRLCSISEHGQSAPENGNDISP